MVKNQLVKVPLYRKPLPGNNGRDGAGGGTRTPTGIGPTNFLTIYGFRRRP